MSNIMTRARAEKAISHGVDPNIFLSHPNRHVREKAQMKLRADLFAQHRTRNQMYSYVVEPTNEQDVSTDIG